MKSLTPVTALLLMLLAVAQLASAQVRTAAPSCQWHPVTVCAGAVCRTVMVCS